MPPETGSKCEFSIYWIWTWSEVVFLLFNERKRALHDLIADTVVIQKRFAK